MSWMPRITFYSFDSPENSWSIITSVVVAIHALLICWAVFFDSSEQIKQQKVPARLVVQTVDLNPSSEKTDQIAVLETVKLEPLLQEIYTEEEELVAVVKEEVEISPKSIKEEVTQEPQKEVAFASSPLPLNPIKKNPLPPTPLEKKTMQKKEEAIKTPPKEVVPKPPVPSKPVTPVKVIKPAEKPAVKPKPVAVKPKEAPIKPTPAKTPPKKPAVDKKVDKAATDKAAELKKKQEADKALDVKKKQEAEAIAKKKSAEQIVEQERKNKLLADAQERIAKIAGSRDKMTPNKGGASSLAALPNAITSLQIDSLPAVKGAPPLNYREVSYRNELAGRLKLLLKLPEYGDVKVNLTLDRTGKVVKAVVISAESAANRKYIEKTLPGLSFPAFGTNFGSATEYTFSITLSNEL